MPKRVVFSFDDKSLESLKKMIKQGRVPRVHHCPNCNYFNQSGEYKEITVRNPETGEERVIVIPKHD